MGRIKTKAVKRLTNQLLREQGATFSSDFTQNKDSLEKVVIIKSKKLRNVIAGSISRQVKLKKDVQDYTA